MLRSSSAEPRHFGAVHNRERLWRNRRRLGFGSEGRTNRCRQTNVIMKLLTEEIIHVLIDHQCADDNFLADELALAN
jgi:hypothetical protein